MLQLWYLEACGQCEEGNDMMLLDFLQKDLKMIVAAIIGTLGFCMFFNVKRDKLIYGCIGGALSVVTYFICMEMGMSLFAQNMVPAAVATLYAEIMARVIKAPATVFLIPGVIPLAPGGKLYDTMRAIVDGNKANANILGQETAVIALGLAVGVVLVSVVFSQIRNKK